MLPVGHYKMAGIFKSSLKASRTNVHEVSEITHEKLLQLQSGINTLTINDLLLTESLGMRMKMEAGYPMPVLSG